MLPVTFQPPFVPIVKITYMLAPTDLKVYFLLIQLGKIKRNSKLLNVLIMQDTHSNVVSNRSSPYLHSDYPLPINDAMVIIVPLVPICHRKKCDAVPMD